MDERNVMLTAKTIEEQILWSIDKWAYLSWGISQKAAIEYEGMATLALRVSGLRHKGWVFISLNEGKDCYEVRLLNVARTKVKTLLEEVYCDNLGEVVDGLVEKDPKLTDDQYHLKSMKDSARKMGMEVIETSNSNNQTNSEDENMRLNMNANQNESANVQAAAPVLNPASPAIEDADAVEITTEADVQEVDDIKPKVVRAAGKAANGGEATTMPLGKHGTLVIAGVGGKKKEEPKVTTQGGQSPSNAATPTHTGDSPLPALTFGTYKTKKGADAPIIMGFGDDDPRWKKMRDAKHKWVSAGYRRDLEGNKSYHMLFGTKYMAVAKALCEAYNTDDRKAWEKAEKACADCYDGIVAGYKAEKEARKAERRAARETEKKPETTGYSSEDVAAMLRKVLAGGDVPEDIKKLLKAA